MPEHLLHAAQVGPAVEQVGGEGVAHVVRGKALVEAGFAQRVLEHLADRVGSHAPAARRHEEELAGAIAQKRRTRLGRVGAHRRDGQIVQGHDALLRPLAEHLRLARLQIHVGGQQARRLGHARAARVEELEDRLVAQVGRTLGAHAARGVALGVHRQKPRHVGRADDMGQALAGAGPRQRPRRILFEDPRHVEPAEEAAQGREPAVDRGARVLGAVELGQVEPQLAMRGPQRLDAGAPRPAQVVHEVGAIGAHRVSGGVALDAQGLAERLDQLGRARVDRERIAGGLSGHRLPLAARPAAEGPPRRALRRTPSAPRRRARRRPRSVRACCGRAVQAAP